MTISADALRALIGDYFHGPKAWRELEIIRARCAGGEPMERIAADYRDVPMQVLVAICTRPTLESRR